MKNKQIIHSIQLNSYTIQRKQLDGKPHIIVPVVMMLEGVHNGSHGAILHTAEELSHITEAWNGIPVTIQHPKNGSNFISANSPDVPYVGRIFNTKFTNGKLKAQAWLDVEKLESTSPTTMAYINQQKPLDVSVGVFTDEEAAEGEWNGESYVAIARNYRPDHLALLPGEQGACSWADGCGIRTNNKNNNKIENNMKKVNPINSLQVNKQSFDEISSQIRQIVYAGEKEDLYFYVDDIYDNYFIYRKETRGVNPSSETYKQSYTINTDDVVELVDDPQKVIKKITYVQTNEINTNNNKNERKTKMSKCLIDKVDALIANTSTKFTDEDRDWLLTQSEAILEKLTPKPVRTAPKADEQEQYQVTEKDVTTFLENKSREDIIKLLPAEIQANVISALALRDKNRADMIAKIQANTGNTWEQAELEAMSCNVLEKLTKSVSKVNPAQEQPADYSANNGGINNNASADDDDLLLPPMPKLVKK